ncbi:hypothetical protein Pmani_015867 [Petrolisthes manimaculis]|uniref:Uncharacterized protein n=1 Tax=Petrolisthes manimaculis TaxID=1843537 RepID=A0AAE1PSZ5_9EUCA|nr:hypothetical protein Pmani_015867 [Petrolisthes manimaculis]
MKGVCHAVLLCLLPTFTLLTLHGCTTHASSLSSSSPPSGGVSRPRNPIDDQIVQALENFRSHMKEGWVELGIPPLDPLHLPHVLFNISNDDTQRLRYLRSNWGYSRVWGGALLIHFEDIMGGGDMAEFVNGVLSSFGLDFLHSLEDHYLPLLEEALKYELNLILQGGGGGGGTDSQVKDDSVNTFFDLLFANMRQSIIDNGNDPFQLPHDRDNFTVELFNTTMEGEVYVGDGWLSGMSTVHRGGNMSLVYVGDEDEVIWGGEVALIDLQTDYRLSLDLALFKKDVSFSLKISYLHISFETDVFLHQSDIVLANCTVAEMGPVHLKEKGSGPLDTPLLNLAANTLLSQLHTLVTTNVQEIVCGLLEDAFTTTE